MIRSGMFKVKFLAILVRNVMVVKVKGMTTHVLHKFHPGSKIRDVHPGSRFFFHPGSRGQKGTGSRTRNRNTAEDREKRKDIVIETRIYVGNTVGVKQKSLAKNLPELFVKFIRNLEQMTRTLA
jgi:hypothetical protein